MSYKIQQNLVRRNRFKFRSPFLSVHYLDSSLPTFLFVCLLLFCLGKIGGRTPYCKRAIHLFGFPHLISHIWCHQAICIILSVPCQVLVLEFDVCSSRISRSSITNHKKLSVSPNTKLKVSIHKTYNGSKHKTFNVSKHITINVFKHETLTVFKHNTFSVFKHNVFNVFKYNTFNVFKHNAFNV